MKIWAVGFAIGFIALIIFQVCSPAAVLYVNVNGSNPNPPYSDWDTAAKDIQSAINAASIGDQVLVTNGVYQTGGQVVTGSLTNRVVVTKAITVQSVNGPGVTAIQGYQVPAVTNGDGAIRCVYLTNNATLIGFTLTNGATRGINGTSSERFGGGIYCRSSSAVISNCVIMRNAAVSEGGGVFQGTLYNSTLTANVSTNGGGAYSSSLINCILAGNNAFSSGGGAYSGSLTNCILMTNSAVLSGGGAYSGTLTNCTLTGNLSGSGGGANSATLVNCLLITNSSSSSGGGASGGILIGCTLTGNSASAGGGANSATMNSCILTSNTASSSGGGANGGAMTNCFLIANSAVSGNGGGANSATLTGCTLTNNSASGNGGGASGGSMNYCIFTGNSAGVNGGGASGSTLKNCALINNSARTGGGASGGALTNCTLTGNSAASYGGGVDSATLNNCIASYNFAPIGPNYNGSTLNYSCTTPLPNGGAGNIGSDPQMASAFHLSAGSPCIGAGKATYATGTDIDGEAWANPPSMGCDEYYPATATGTLTVQIRAVYTNAVAGFGLDFFANIVGVASASAWDFGDGTVISNRLSVSHAWGTPGDYLVVLRAYNNSNPGGVSAVVTVHIVTQPVHYVALSSATPITPYSTWATAATNIQDAVNAATVCGALVVVSNGVYGIGGKAAFGAMTNRVAVTMPLVLQSLNGPSVTTIQGSQVAGTTIGNSAVRCVYLAGGASLIGFTLTNGATRATGDLDQEQSGGGVWCASPCTVVSNCVLAANAASEYGAGAYLGTLATCTLTNNWASYYGGASYYGTLSNCTLINNSAPNGGGTYSCTMNNCLLTSNTSFSSGGGANGGTMLNCTFTGNSAMSGSGGGANSANLTNCVFINNAASANGGGANGGTIVGTTFTGNSASANGGGASSATLYNCTFTNNATPNNGGGVYSSTLTNCILQCNFANNGGGMFSSTLSGCILTGNVATNGGGAYYGSLVNCILTANQSSSFGGGAYDSSLTGCIVSSNSASTCAGGAYGGYSLTFTGSTFTGNSAGIGGGAYAATLINCVLAGNSALAGDGGGANSATLTGCTLTNNSASGNGGGASGGSMNYCIFTGNSAGVNGGGASGSTLKNCALINNSARTGGGASGGALTNCTLTGNSAASYGGGVDSATLNNCIASYNFAPIGPNYNGSTLNYSCTTPLPNGGAGNIGSDPQMASAFHLSAGSPCIGAGKATYATGTDIDGEAWANPPSMGCDEYYPATATGTLTVQIRAVYTNAVAGFGLDFFANIVGVASASAWDFGDGTVISNRLSVSHAWGTPGDYLVVLRAYNNSNPGGVSAVVTVHIVTQPVHYVALSSATPITPYSTWATAATNIQDAVNAATVCGALVVVSNGVYGIGGKAAFGAMTNRVAVTMPLVLQSLNGPSVTTIQGSQVAGTTIGNSAVRCVYLAGGASLIGFTLTNGATRATGDLDQEQSGGGVWCASPCTVVSNCVLAANAASEYGAGAYLGTLATCTLTNNWASYYGGASYYGTLSNCTLINNSARTGSGAYCATLAACTLSGNFAYTIWGPPEGGGAYSSVLTGCLLANNSSGYGGGVSSSSLTNCTLIGNKASAYGGGTYNSTLNQCTLTSNSVSGYGGGAYSGTLIGCSLSGNSATDRGGGIYNSVLNNCTLAHNFATSDGGGAYASALTNCLLTGNSANIGGATESCILNHCSLNNNTASFVAGGAYNGTLSFCILTGNVSSNSTGGTYGSTLTSCLLIANSAVYGGGAYVSTLFNCTLVSNSASTYGGGAPSCIMHNGISYYNNAPTNANYDSHTLIDYSCTFPLATNGVGNITNEPFFLNLSASNLRLQTNSPCINTGTNVYVSGSFDLDGRTRIVGNRVDMGTYEFQSAGIGEFTGWLQQYGLSTDGSADYADSDKTGMNNWQKWIAGLNPTNSASVLAMLPPIAINSSAGVTVSWQSVNTRTYYLQRATNLAIQPAFTAIQSNIVGQAGTTSYTDTNAFGLAPFFYRVGVQ